MMEPVVGSCEGESIDAESDFSSVATPTVMISSDPPRFDRRDREKVVYRRAAQLESTRRAKSKDTHL